MKARTSGKSRLFIGFTVILLLFVFALFLSSSQQQVDELRVAGIKCEQHEMALKAQFDAQVEKLAHLERSGEEMQQKLRAEKELREKALKDSNMRFASLQQHYRSVQKELEDVKTEYEDAKRDYEERIKSLTTDLDGVDKNKAVAVEEWKNKFMELEHQFKRLEDAVQKEGAGDASALKLKNQQLTEELNEMYNHCAFRVNKGSSSAASPVSYAKGNEILPKPIVAANQENVLKEPGIESPMKKSSTATFNKKEAQKPLEQALPIAVAQNQSPPLKAATEASPKARKLPNGVVPIPESMNILLNNEEAPQDVKNSRYSNVGDSPIGPLPESGEHKDTNFLLNGNEVENGAHEVNDFNIVEDHHNHHDNIPEDEDKIVINNNAAEVEVHPGDQDEKEKRNELDLAIINRDLHGKDGLGHKKGNEDFVADQGFEDHMEEHVEEEDDDEYPNLAAQQEEGPAVRN